MDDFRPAPPPRSRKRSADGDESTATSSDPGDELASDEPAVSNTGASSEPPDVEPSDGEPSDGVEATPIGDLGEPDPLDAPSAPTPRPDVDVGLAWKRVDKRLWIVAAVGLVVVVALAVTFLGGSGKPHTLHGTIALVAPGDIVGTSADCRGKNEFADFAPGMVVTVDDGTGKVLATGKTRNVDAGDDAASAAGSSPGVQCVLAFEVGVGDAREYRVTIGTRGTQTYSRADLDADGWKVVFNLA